LPNPAVEEKLVEYSCFLNAVDENEEVEFEGELECDFNEFEVAPVKGAIG
jgi:hypothetical protein